jgi:hypothetical protein
LLSTSNLRRHSSCIQIVPTQIYLSISKENYSERKDVLAVGDGGEKPIEVLLVDALGEESDKSEEVSRVWAEATQCLGGKGEFDGCGEACYDLSEEPASDVRPTPSPVGRDPMRCKMQWWRVVLWRERESPGAREGR